MSLVHTDSERNLIADTLGDTPETAIPAHLLGRGNADETAWFGMNSPAHQTNATAPY